MSKDYSAIEFDDSTWCNVGSLHIVRSTAGGWYLVDHDAGEVLAGEFTTSAQAITFFNKHYAHTALGA